MPQTSFFFFQCLLESLLSCASITVHILIVSFLTDLFEYMISSLTTNKATTCKTSCSRFNHFDTQVETCHYRRENICGRLACLLCTSLCHTAEQSRQEKEKKTRSITLCHTFCPYHTANHLQICLQVVKKKKKNRNENTSWELNGSVYILLLCCHFYFLNSLEAEEVIK